MTKAMTDQVSRGLWRWKSSCAAGVRSSDATQTARATPAGVVEAILDRRFTQGANYDFFLR
ncbi:hypothetical protein PATSB16_24230 [Pandoraea thiooxydans]|nr:hypothetical protein PATSB16_24230 [Pandoraea thiooxydans]